MEKEDIVKKIETYGYSPVSAQKLYETAMSFINKKYPGTDILDKPLGKMRKLVMYENPNTRRNIAKALMILQKATNKPQKVQDATLRYYKKVFSKSMEERKNAIREKIDSSGFDKKREEMEEEFDELTSQNDAIQILQLLPKIILMRLIADMPTRRANDYRTLLLKKPKDGADKANYYSNGRIYYNKFKTKETGNVSLSGDQPITKFFKRTKNGVVFDVSPELRTYFNLLRKLDRSRKYLIERSDREPYNPSMFSKFIVKTFGMTVNDFRKRWVQMNVNSDEVKKAKEVAADMSNTLETQQRDYAERE